MPVTCFESYPKCQSSYSTDTTEQCLIPQDWVDRLHIKWKPHVPVIMGGLGQKKKNWPRLAHSIICWPNQALIFQKNWQKSLEQRFKDSVRDSYKPGLRLEKTVIYYSKYIICMQRFWCCSDTRVAGNWQAPPDFQMLTVTICSRHYISLLR